MLGNRRPRKYDIQHKRHRRSATIRSNYREEKKADTAMPMQSNEGGKYSGYEYVQVTKSPGFAFILNREQLK